MGVIYVIRISRWINLNQFSISKWIYFKLKNRIRSTRSLEIRLITIIHCNHENGHYVSTMKSFLAKTFVIAMWKWPLSRKIFLEETLKPKINRNTIWYKLKHITSQIYKMIISYPDNCIPFVNDSGLNNFCFNGLFSWYRGLSLRFLSWLLRNLWVLLPACNNLLAADS